ncbi:hypothetical protein CALVIDRAFT_561611 [Calocera viscosa TUFC12733]|uniref:Uncharacterized protein n=1 Tax=Calocera viscosa (strain TUFC12733) TaxID=1330018 RepID=A0A167PXC4_CALVF|nr:hypothetical protein CALVIDRAFT_561611 [Calocera viscosa TUFC12733]
MARRRTWRPADPASASSAHPQPSPSSDPVRRTSQGTAPTSSRAQPPARAPSVADPSTSAPVVPGSSRHTGTADAVPGRPRPVSGPEAPAPGPPDVVSPPSLTKALSFSFPELCTWLATLADADPVLSQMYRNHLSTELDALSKSKQRRLFKWPVPFPFRRTKPPPSEVEQASVSTADPATRTEIISYTPVTVTARMPRLTAVSLLVTNFYFGLNLLLAQSFPASTFRDLLWRMLVTSRILDYVSLHNHSTDIPTMMHSVAFVQGVRPVDVEGDDVLQDVLVHASPVTVDLPGPAQVLESDRMSRSSQTSRSIKTQVREMLATAKRRLSFSAPERGDEFLLELTGVSIPPPSTAHSQLYKRYKREAREACAQALAAELGAIPVYLQAIRDWIVWSVSHDMSWWPLCLRGIIANIWGQDILRQEHVLFVNCAEGVLWQLLCALFAKPELLDAPGTFYFICLNIREAAKCVRENGTETAEKPSTVEYHLRKTLREAIPLAQTFCLLCLLMLSYIRTKRPSSSKHQFQELNPDGSFSDVPLLPIKELLEEMSRDREWLNWKQYKRAPPSWTF